MWCALPRRVSPTGAALSLAVLSFALLAGCRKASKEHVLDMPSAGTVKVLSRQIERSDRRLHWKWSLLGERNWTTPTAAKTDFRLADTYPLNDPTHRGGCNVWECDLIAETGTNGVTWTATLHGSDGATVRSGATLPLKSGVNLEDVVSIRLDRDDIPSLPADISLASLGDQKLTLHVAK